MQRSIFILIIYLLIIPAVNAKQLAITFDDAPRKADGYFDSPTRAKVLIESLEQHKIGKVAFFSTTQSLDKEGLERMRRYDKAGHIIGNHTHSHPNFLKTELSAYQADFLRAHQLLQQFDNFKPYFRFPYLREGETVEKRGGMRSLLQENNYQNAYITLNNYDWYIEELFQSAVKDGRPVDMERLSSFYVDVLMASINYYDAMASKYLGHSPKHVILLHEMDITALFIGDLAQRLRQEGWKIIPLEEAYKDPIATYQLSQPIKYNPGRIGEIALAKGQKKSLWHDTLDESYLQKRFNQEVLLMSAH